MIFCVLLRLAEEKAKFLESLSSQGRSEFHKIENEKPKEPAVTPNLKPPKTTFDHFEFNTVGNPEPGRKLQNIQKLPKGMDALSHPRDNPGERPPPDVLMERNPGRQVVAFGNWSYALWEGLSPEDLEAQGLKVTGKLPLRPFIDLDDRTAAGMKGRPQSVLDMQDAEAEDRFYQWVAPQWHHINGLM